MVHLDAEELFDQVLDDPDQSSYVRSRLPVFLRRFTRGSILAYILTKSVEVLERFKKHDRAAELLKKLLKQDLYLPDYHGHW